MQALNSAKPRVTKAMILAAGLGTRMRPLTLHTPKPLLRVGDKPLIVWHLLALKAAGISDIVINAAYLADTLIAALGDGNQYGVHIQWSIEQEPLETAGGIVQALPLLGDQPFLLINGDVWTQVNYADVLAQADSVNGSSCQGFLCLIDNPSHNPTGDFYLHNNHVLAHSSAANEAKFTFAGISLLHPALFSQLTPGKAPLAPLLRAAMDKGQIQGQRLDTMWVDVGTIERLDWLNGYISQHGIS